MITSRNQGQIFGSKPSMEDFERQLNADPVYKSFLAITAALATLRAIRSVSEKTVTTVPTLLQKLHLAH